MIKTDFSETDFKDEQLICVQCGFCCDGTLFNNAALDPGEKGNLPQKIELGYLKRNKKEFFKLPCLYFDSRCSIYYHKKANVCSSYRCRILKDFSNERLTLENAIEIISNAKRIRQELFKSYFYLSGRNKNLCFKELLKNVHKKVIKRSTIENPPGDLGLLLAKCNIFEALLTRHFRSAKEFSDLMESSSENINK